MRILTPIAGVLVLGLIGYAFYQQPASHTVLVADAAAFTCPQTPTSAEVTAFVEASAKHQTLPSGWQVTSNEGKVTATDTGMVMLGTNERAWSVSILDEQPDLSTATVYLNSQAVFTATRANGGIIDRSGWSLATLPVLVPPQGQAFSLKVSWTANSGAVRDYESWVP